MRIKTKEIGENFPAGFTSGNVYSWSQLYTNDNFSAIQYTNSGKYLSTTREAWELPVVEITKTGPLEKLVWALIKDPDNEIKTIHNRTGN
jgi:hypothetical protein